jgi:hypothetical protein
MSNDLKIKYFGWSGLSIETPDGALFFDPFFRPYCGASWFHMQDYAHAKYICVTHGHEEHFLDVPAIAKATGAMVIGAPSVSAFLRRRHKLGEAQLRSIDPARGESVSLPGFDIASFTWKHRDINLYKALTKAVFHGNATQLSWAWSSATNAPFYAPYTGFHVTMPNGMTVLNYNEGFNTKMTDQEIADLGKRFKTDVLLAGMQLNFVDDVVRGVAALRPKTVLLYPPHDKFHEMMGVASAPWADFARAIAERFPDIDVHIAGPGFEWRADGSVSTFAAAA